MVFQTRIANLLGVAGTDVPISEIKKLLEPFKVSVPQEYFGYHVNVSGFFGGSLRSNCNGEISELANLELNFTCVRQTAIILPWRSKWVLVISCHFIIIIFLNFSAWSRRLCFHRYQQWLYSLSSRPASRSKHTYLFYFQPGASGIELFKFLCYCRYLITLLTFIKIMYLMND